MKVSIPVLSDRISPVFDESRTLLLIEIEDGKEVRRREETLHGMGPLSKTVHLVGLGVDILICSAISWPLERRLAAAGVQVISQTCGPVDDVLNAYLSGRLTEHAFLTPGCRCRRGRRHGGGAGRSNGWNRRPGRR